MKLGIVAGLAALLLGTPLLAQSADDVAADAAFAKYCATLDQQHQAAAAPDPVAAVRGLYQEGMELPERALPLTPRLQDLFLREDRRVCELETPIGRLDFDWIVNGQDALISDIAVEPGKVTMALPDEPERMVVTARFKNFDRQNVIDYYWEKGSDGWRLDDVASRGDFPWTLSLLLAYGS